MYSQRLFICAYPSIEGGVHVSRTTSAKQRYHIREYYFSKNILITLIITNRIFAIGTFALNANAFKNIQQIKWHSQRGASGVARILHWRWPPDNQANSVYMLLS